jgi:hypothetical protein
MHDHGDKKKTQGSESNSQIIQAERRGGGRHGFIATADIVELGSGSGFSTRVSDLGPGGCFVDTLLPLAAGAKVRVSILEGQNRFQATGLVVYSQSGLGMGVAFDPLKAEQREALAVWLGKDVAESPDMTQEDSEAPRTPGLPYSSDREALLRLVKLMMSKAILSEAEAASIFGNPLF